MGRKLEAVSIWGGAGSTSNTVWPGRRPTSVPCGILINQAVWPQQTWAENLGAVLSILARGAEFPFSAMWPGPRPISIRSSILIHPAVLPQ